MTGRLGKLALIIQTHILTKFVVAACLICSANAAETDVGSAPERSSNLILLAQQNQLPPPPPPHGGFPAQNNPFTNGSGQNQRPATPLPPGFGQGLGNQIPPSTRPQQATDGAIWQYYGSMSGEPNEAILIHGIPETDASDLIIRCYLGTGEAEMGMVASSQLLSPTSVLPVSLRVGAYQTTVMAQPISKDLYPRDNPNVSAPGLRLRLNAPFWRTLTAGRLLEIDINQLETFTVPVQGLAAYMDTFLTDCRQEPTLVTQNGGQFGQPSDPSSPFGNGTTDSSTTVSGQMTGYRGGCVHDNRNVGGQSWRFTTDGSGGALAYISECADCEIAFAVQCLRPNEPLALWVPYAAVSRGQEGEQLETRICVDGFDQGYFSETEEQGAIGFLPRMHLPRGHPLPSLLARGNYLRVEYQGLNVDFSLRGSRNALEQVQAFCGWY